MPVIISMLRGVNVGGHNKIKMDALRDLYESLKLRAAQTFIQSGNVVFRTNEPDLGRLAEKIGRAIEKRFGFRPEVVVRTSSELKQALARSPFAKTKGIDPAKLLITFLSAEPGSAALEQVRKIKTDPEE